MLDIPLLVTDGRYTWAHVERGKLPLGPFTPLLTEDGQVSNTETNGMDPTGLIFNPAACIGGRVHTVENPLFPPDELWALAIPDGP